MIKNDQIKEISRQTGSKYNLNFVEIEPAGCGSGNSNYILKTQTNTFVLCVIEEQSEKEVETMAQTLLWLDSHGYSSTKLQMTSNNSLTTIINGKPALLRKYLHGDVCWVLDSLQIHQVGVSIASLHLLPCPSYVPKDIYYNQERFMRALKSGHDSNYEAWVSKSLKHLNLDLYINLPRGLIHSDIFPDNILFQKRKFIALIDFELACNYILTFDIAMAIIGICITDGKPCRYKIKSLLSGYESVRELSIEEKQSIKPLAEYAAIITSLWRYWRYCCYEPNHIKQHAYKQLEKVARQITTSDSFEAI